MHTQCHTKVITCIREVFICTFVIKTSNTINFISLKCWTVLLVFVKQAHVFTTLEILCSRTIPRKLPSNNFHHPLHVILSWFVLLNLSLTSFVTSFKHSQCTVSYASACDQCTRILQSVISSLHAVSKYEYFYMVQLKKQSSQCAEVGLSK